MLRSGPTPQAAKLIDERRALGACYDRVDSATDPNARGAFAA
jgi:hypothetical protein